MKFFAALANGSIVAVDDQGRSKALGKLPEPTGLLAWGDSVLAASGEGVLARFAASGEVARREDGTRYVGLARSGELAVAAIFEGALLVFVPSTLADENFVELDEPVAALAATADDAYVSFANGPLRMITLQSERIQAFYPLKEGAESMAAVSGRLFTMLDGQIAIHNPLDLDADPLSVEHRRFVALAPAGAFVLAADEQGVLWRLGADASAHELGSMGLVPSQLSFRDGQAVAGTGKQLVVCACDLTANTLRRQQTVKLADELVVLG